MATIKQLSKQLDVANKRISDYNKKVTYHQERLDKAISNTNKKYGTSIAVTDIITKTSNYGRLVMEDYSLPENIKEIIGFDAEYSITEKYNSMKQSMRKLNLEEKHTERLNVELQALIAQKDSEDAKYNNTLDAALRKSMEEFRIVWFDQMIAWHKEHFNFIKEQTPAMRSLRKRIEPIKWYFGTFRHRKNHSRIYDFLTNKEQYCSSIIGDWANRFDQIDQYIEEVEKALEDSWNQGVVKLTKKCQDYGLEEDKIITDQPTMTDKGFEVVIRDGKPRLIYARVIWAAEDSDLVQPHIRYIVTERKIK
jgi:hypothetical protein